MDAQRDFSNVTRSQVGGFEGAKGCGQSSQGTDGRNRIGISDFGGMILVGIVIVLFRAGYEFN
jgi:hypothetical protein